MRLAEMQAKLDAINTLEELAVAFGLDAAAVATTTERFASLPTSSSAFAHPASSSADGNLARARLPSKSAFGAKYGTKIVAGAVGVTGATKEASRSTMQVLHGGNLLSLHAAVMTTALSGSVSGGTASGVARASSSSPNVHELGPVVQRLFNGTGSASTPLTLFDD